jgi:hypothetical protein
MGLLKMKMNAPVFRASPISLVIVFWFVQFVSFLHQPALLNASVVAFIGIAPEDDDDAPR